MPLQAKKQDAPDFIPAEEPDFIPDPGGAGSASSAPAREPDAEGGFAPETAGVGGDLLAGVGKGLLHTGTGLSPLINKIPVLGKYLAPQQGIDAARSIATPKNTAQKLGYYGEQAAEFMLPGPAEEAAGAKLAGLLPGMAKAAPRLLPAAGRLGMQLADSAAINKLQGGDASTGAEAGLLGGGIGEVGRAAAPALAESAMGIAKRMRGYGRTPGAAVLGEIRGVRPSTIFKNASERTGQLTNDIEGMAASHPGTIDMRPAIKTIDDEIAKATTQNNAQAIEQLGRVREALTKNATNGLPLSADQTATGALNLKRGLRKQFVKNWNPEIQAEIPAVAKQASGSIDSGLDTALGPDFASKNQRISSLIPIADRAESLERDPSIMQKIGRRLGAHTGALAGTLGGGAIGYEKGGVPGAVGGAIGGLVVPELLTSPTAGMVFARGLHSGAPVRFGKGAALQMLGRDSNDTEGNKKRKNSE